MNNYKIDDGSEIIIRGEFFVAKKTGNGWMLTDKRVNVLSKNFLTSLKESRVLVDELAHELQDMSRETTEDWNNNPIVRAVGLAEDIQIILADLDDVIEKIDPAYRINK